jgi:hypothetical protein
MVRLDVDTLIKSVFRTTVLGTTGDDELTILLPDLCLDLFEGWVEA